ncbi:uncharacterized protein METZ01_LOCUS413151, partial [marine metagenome]
MIDAVPWSKTMKAKMNIRMMKQITVGRTAPKASARKPADNTPASPINPMRASMFPAS